VAQVVLDQSFGFGFGKFPLKMPIFSIFTLRVKINLLGSDQKVPGSKAGQPLIYCRSKVSSGWVGSRPISRQNTLMSLAPILNREMINIEEIHWVPEQAQIQLLRIFAIGKRLNLFHLVLGVHWRSKFW